LYLAVILDLFSRRVVGRACTNGWSARWRWKCCTWHWRSGNLRRDCCTIRGIQYFSREDQQMPPQYGIRGDISRKGNCWDNAWRKASSPRSSSNWSARVGGTRELRLGAIFEYIEPFTIANCGTPLSVLAPEHNSNVVTMN
jgi:transposase InsO family protein